MGVDSASLNPTLERLLKERGWTGLTELQRETAVAIRRGYNVLIMAPTGEGKTEAAILPLFSMIAESGAQPVAVLYVTPMKSLINDLYRRLVYWAQPLGLKVAKKHGDVPSAERSLRLRSPPHVLLTTPESLEIDLDWATKFREYYRNLKAVVIDEVHELLSSKRGAQLLALLERLVEMAGDFQRVALSATVADPESSLRLISGSSTRPGVVVLSGRKRRYNLKVRYVSDDGEPWGKIVKLVVDEASGPTLVFTNSRYTTEKLGHEVQQFGYSNVLVHHSSLSADIRESAEKRLREGGEVVVVCTRTLELGIDIGHVNKVVQVRSPGSVASLLQRVGRSHHRLGGVPEGTIIAVGPIDYAEAVAESNLALRGYIENETIRWAPADVLAKEIIGMAMSKSSNVRVADVVKVLSRLSYLGVTEERILELIDYLKQNNMLVEENGFVRVGPAFYKIWRFGGKEESWAPRDFSEFFSSIPKRDLFSVRSGDNVIGFIDSTFVYRSLRVGDRVRLAGKTWEVARIDETNQRIEVVPAEGEAEIPLWRGEGSKRSEVVAREFLNVVFDDSKCLGHCDEEGLSSLEPIRAWYMARGAKPGQDRLIVEQVGDEQVLIYPFGSRVAETLSLLLLGRSIKEQGLAAMSRSTFFGVSAKQFPGDVIEYLRSLRREDLEKAIDEVMRYLPQFYKELAEVKYDLGKLGELDDDRDSFLIREISRSVKVEELDIEGAWRFIKDLKEGRIAVVRITGGPSPLASYVLTTPALRPWVPDLGKRIAKTLGGWAFTLIELANELGLPEKTLLNKLKEMRRPEYGNLRVTAFFDISSDEWRWALDAELQEIAALEDFSQSFQPLRLEEEFRVYVRRAFNLEGKELLLRPKDIVERWSDVAYLLGSEDLYELKVERLDEESSVVMHYVSWGSLKLLLLNAMAALQARGGAGRLSP